MVKLRCYVRNKREKGDKGMKFTPERINQIEQSLIDGKVMQPGDHIQEYIQGDYWEKFLCFYSQIRGYYYFTNESVIFVGGLAGSTFWGVKYKNIKEMKKCNVAFFIPTGISITGYDEIKGKDVKYKLSVMKRQNWIDYIAQRANNTPV